MRIAVFRALQLGDLLTAVPAWRALRAAHRHARITLIGLPWAATLAARLTCIDDFVAFPGHPALPELASDGSALPAFLAAMRAQRFDLALQMHGSGPVVNDIVRGFGAARCAGFEPDAASAARAGPGWVTWPARGHEIERLLALTDALGCARRGTHLEFPLQDADRRAVRCRFPELEPGSYAVVHPGSQLPSRRWPVERFAAVAAELEQRGLRVVATGTRDEAPLTRAALARCLDGIDAAGRTSLWEVAALIEGAAVLVANDTGVSHIAAALGTPSVIVSAGADVARWAPLTRSVNRVLAVDVPCRPCSHRVCPTQHECARAVAVDHVVQPLNALLEPAHA
jgi:ADP-heptose:LPS heptosyltransferase